MGDDTNTTSATTKEDKKARRARVLAERQAAEALANGSTQTPEGSNQTGSSQPSAAKPSSSLPNKDASKQNQPRGGKGQAAPAPVPISAKINAFHPMASAVSHLHLALEDRGSLINNSSWSLLHKSFQTFLINDAQGKYLDANALTTGFSQSLCDFIADYKPTTENALKNELIDILSSQASLLLTFRPMTTGEANIFSYIRNLLTTVPVTLSNEELKSTLLSPKGVPAFVEKRISVSETVQSYLSIDPGASKASADRSLLILPNSTVLTYGYDETVVNTLIRLHSSPKSGSSFHVVVLDSRPHLLGQMTLKKLTKAKISATYAPLASLSALLLSDQLPAMALLPAVGVSVSGSVTGPSGSAVVAALCKAKNIPVYVISETYKYSGTKASLEVSGLTSNQLAPVGDLLCTPDAMLPRDRALHIPSTQPFKKEPTALTTPVPTSLGVLAPLLDETVIGDRTRTPAAPKPERSAGAKAQNPLASNPDAALEEVPYQDNFRTVLADGANKSKEADSVTPTAVAEEEVAGVTSSSEVLIKSLKANSFAGLLSHPSLQVGAVLYDIIPAHTVTKYLCEFGALAFDSYVYAAEQMQSLQL